MANLERIVNVQISLNTSNVTREGFSTALLVGEHAHTLERVTTYTNIDDMIADGFNGDDMLYLAAQDFFSQTPKPKEVKIGRRKCNAIVNVADIVPLGTYTAHILMQDSLGSTITTTYDYANTGLTDPVDILTELANVINADTSSDVTANIQNGQLVIFSVTGVPFAVKVSDNLVSTAAPSTETIADCMAEIVADDNDWYGVALMSRNQDDILSMAAWTEAHRKLFGTAIAEEGAKVATNYTDTGYLLMKENYFRTFWFYHKTADSDFPEVAVMARCFAISPGGETWANKRLAGVEGDGLTETEFNAIVGKNGNTFENFRNVAITQRGMVAAGEWIDIIRFRDWLQEEITTRVFDALVNTDKIPYTDAGIAIIENQIKSALELGQRRGGIAPDEEDENGNLNLGFVVTVPRASSISASQKASRILEDVTFTARLAGAIHAVEIKGNLTYENLIVAS